MRRIFFAACVSILSTIAAAQETKLLQDFETDADLNLWSFNKKSGSIVAEHATHGQKCLKIASTEHMFLNRVPKDWSAFDVMEIDVFVDGRLTAILPKSGLQRCRGGKNSLLRGRLRSAAIPSGVFAPGGRGS